MNTKVSIGLPVYNGENYLAQAIESVLAQTYPDYELIISDNASADRTQEICERYAAQDPRIRYFRQETNRGATWNYNHVFKLASGAYFNWLAHDDMLAPDFLQKCVAVLDQNPDTVLCFSKVLIVDERSNPIDKHEVLLRTDSSRPSQRFYDLLMVWHDCLPIFGLIRAASLRKTPLIGSYASGDHVLLARLGLMGKFCILQETLFLSRRHPLQSNKLYNVWLDHHAYSRWFDASNQGKIDLPQWRVVLDFARMVSQARANFTERFFCYLAILRWMLRYRKLLWKDLVIAIKVLLGRKPGTHSQDRTVGVKVPY